MTEQEYHQALERTHIKSGPDWNRRYLEALSANGLALQEGLILESSQPDYYIQAPMPVPNDKSGFWDESLIVPVSDRTASPLAAE